MAHYDPIETRLGSFETPFKFKTPNSPLGKLENGVIMFPVSETVSAPGEKFYFSAKQEIDPSELRRAILYWDRIDIPIGLIAARSEEIDELERANIVQRTEYWPNAEEFMMIFGEESRVIHDMAHIKILERYESIEPGKWDIQSSSNSRNKLKNKRMLCLCIADVVPQPAPETPIHEILEFKNKRKDELENFHEHLREVERRISAPGVEPASKEYAIRRLERSIEEAMKVAREAKFPFRLSSLKVTIDNSSILNATVDTPVGYGAAFSFAPSSTIAAIAGLAWGARHFISFERELGGIRKESSHLEYVSMAARQWT